MLIIYILPVVRNVYNLHVHRDSCVISVTIISTIIMGILFLSEVNYYLTPTLSEELFVDTSRGSKLRINLDIIVPSISCDRKCTLHCGNLLSQAMVINTLNRVYFSFIHRCDGHDWRTAFTNRA